MMTDLFGQVSTADTGERSDLDFYESPSWMTRSLLAFHPAIKQTIVLECASGRDAITRVLREEGACAVFTNDLNRAHPAETHEDASELRFWSHFTRKHGCPDWVVTNLPFNVAIDILPHALAHVRVGVATVLLKSFDEPTEDRGPWLHAHPWTRKICQPRHSFRGTGSPSMASDWFIWEREPDRRLPACVVDHLAKSRTRA